MKNRFEISAEGMKLLHQNRPLWQLVKELVANAWDEPTADTCWVDISHDAGIITVEVTDNGQGFSDISDAYTLMAPSAKTTNAQMRGRFNIGEKEIISISHHAEVRTGNKLISFPPEGGFIVSDSVNGETSIICHIEVDPEDAGRIVAETVEALQLFLSPLGQNYYVNGRGMGKRIPARSTRANLPTILATGPGEPLKMIPNSGTDIDIYDVRPATGRIFEMGIPIQEVDMPFDVNIMQKVPMPPNRDVVSSSYLQDVYAEVLKVTSDLDIDFGEAWVTKAVEDTRTPNNVVKVVMDNKLGSNAMLYTNDRQANEDAFDHGKNLIAPTSLSKAERERYRDVGLGSASMYTREAGGADATPYRRANVTTEMEDVASMAKTLAKRLLDRTITVEFVSDPKFGASADYGSGHMRFDVFSLGVQWFELSNETEQIELIMHELAHDKDVDIPHGRQYINFLGHLYMRAYKTRAFEGL